VTAAALVAALCSRGVELVPVGDRLRFRPASKVPPELLAHLREHKAEVLRLLTAPRPTSPTLDPETVREVLGPHADNPHAVACIVWDVQDALRDLEHEILTGQIAPGPRVVHGRPLGDWLMLDEVARTLRSAGRRM